METNPHIKKTSNKPGVLGSMLLRLLVVVLLAAACTMATPLGADAAQTKRQDPSATTRTTQMQRQPVPPIVRVPAPRPTPEPAPTKTPAPVDDDRAKLKGDAIAFVDATSLPSQPEYARMFRTDIRDLFAVAPSYSEPVAVIGEKLKVDRTIDYELKPGVCQSSTNRRSLGDLCFAVDRNAAITPEIAAHLAEVRSSLQNANPSSVVVPGVSVAAAQDMSDIDLLELSLNSGPRSITRSSTMPIADDGSLIELDPTDPVVASTFAGTALQSQAITDGVFAGDLVSAAPFNFDTEYFLTGHTIYRSYSDEWSYEKDAWWHPRLFVSFSYAFNAGFGVRAPFSIDVNYVSGDADETVVAVSVDPASLDVAADEVGLPSGAYFDGKEFVLELNFDCALTASIAGLGGTVECDDIYSIDTSFSRDFDPVIGSETRNIANWFLWEDGKSPLRQELLGGAIFGEVNLGIGADVMNGQVGVQIDADNNSDISGVTAGDTTWFDDRSATKVTVERDSRLGSSGIEVSNPQYHFDVAVRPKVKFTAGVDTSVYDNSWSFTAPLDFLGFSLGFGLDHHDNTVESHEYELYAGIQAETEFNSTEQVLAGS